MKFVEIYTDGACSGNPGPGGWACILNYKGKLKELCGGEAATTNNRMELTAVINALKELNQSCVVKLHTDSQYVINGICKGWAKSWQSNNWIKKDKKPALNSELWEELLELLEKHEVEFCWVKGHDGNEMNERCDQLAVEQCSKYK